MIEQILEDYSKRLRLSCIITSLPRASFEAPEQFTKACSKLDQKKWHEISKTI